MQAWEKKSTRGTGKRQGGQGGAVGAPDAEMKVIAVVVTYNRKMLLLECLDAILSQTAPVSGIVLIDNASTDGTREALEAGGYLDNAVLEYHLMDHNTGGAGGFCEGMKAAREKDCDWIWVMDDDTVPESTCLEELLAALRLIRAEDVEKPISFLTSAVYGENREYMNVPSISRKPSPNGYAYWHQYLSSGIVSISSATFVSLLINREAVRRCGLPDPDFFLWGDDLEYTTRLTSFFGDAFLVGRSVAIHKRKGAKTLEIENETDPDRIKLYYLQYRNGAIRYRYYRSNARGIARCIYWVLRSPLALGKKNGRYVMSAILKGHLEALFQYKKFKTYIDRQLGRG